MSDVSPIMKWLDELARYFENRDTGGEDRAHWANVYNSENALKVKAALQAAEARIYKLEAQLEGSAFPKVRQSGCSTVEEYIKPPITPEERYALFQAKAFFIPDRFLLWPMNPWFLIAGKLNEALSAAEARIAKLEAALTELAAHCYDCDGTGVVRRLIGPAIEIKCPVCLGARAALTGEKP